MRRGLGLWQWVGAWSAACAGEALPVPRYPELHRPASTPHAEDVRRGGRLFDDFARELGQELRDLFAAGCDRARYPRANAAAQDVPDGDARRGTLLQ